MFHPSRTIFDVGDSKIWDLVLQLAILLGILRIALRFQLILPQPAPGASQRVECVTLPDALRSGDVETRAPTILVHNLEQLACESTHLHRDESDRCARTPAEKQTGVVIRFE